MSGRVRRSGTCAAALALAVLACSGGDARRPGGPTLRWYANPDNGGQARLAARCTAEAGGRWRLEVLPLPSDASQQREQLVRRLAARDVSIDLMSLDLPFVPELAEAGFLRPFTESEGAPLAEGVLRGALASATWRGRLVAAPFTASTQLLWFRRSVAAKAGLPVGERPVTWRELIAAAERTSSTVAVQANRYEGYMVWVTALVASAGGRILENAEAGKHAHAALDGEAGRRAAAVIRSLARSAAADPALSTADEEAARATFQGARGGFMVNWPYVHGAAQAAVAAGSLDRAVLDDLGWARYPRVDDDRASRPPLGGIDLAVGAFSRHGALAVEAVRCLTSRESQRAYMLDARNPAARAAVYDDVEVRRVFPMADLLRRSIDEAGARPQTPYYTDVSAAVVRAFHPPREVDPERTPAAAARLVADVLLDRVLL
ncbi:MAG TPA: extracellular solute-binding protein [Anaeromyxobacteraceae bacterium]|nr:extracellular solute-binding protein [Anaeromyxobacteraceae bacterium]